MERDQVQAHAYGDPNASTTASSSTQFRNSMHQHEQNHQDSHNNYAALDKQEKASIRHTNNTSLPSSSSQVEQSYNNDDHMYMNQDVRKSTETLPQEHHTSYGHQQEYHELDTNNNHDNHINHEPQDQTHYRQQQHEHEPPLLQDPQYNDTHDRNPEGSPYHPSSNPSGLGNRFVEPDRLDQEEQPYEYDYPSRYNNQEFDRVLTDRDIVESLPEGVQLPPSVDSDLLGERLLSMLLQLPMEQINEALTEYDDAVRVKRNIRNHQAYLHGVLKRYLSVLEKSRESGAKPMGSEITEKVMLRMKDLVDDHFCTNEELLHNERILSKIKMLPEHEALSAIEELAGSNRAQIRNFGSYFMGILNRYMRGEKLMQRSTTRRGYGYRDHRSRRSVDDDPYEDERGHFRRNYRRDRSFSPGRNDNPPPRRGRRVYKDEDDFYDTRERSRSRDRYDFDDRFERRRGKPRPNARDYSPPFQRLPPQEQSTQPSAASDNLDPPTEQSTFHQPSPENGQYAPSMQKNHTIMSQPLNGTTNSVAHMDANGIPTSEIPVSQNGTSNSHTLLSKDTTTETTRLNASLPTSRWVPPSEIRESSPPHSYREERGGYPRSRRAPPPYDTRPVDPSELDIPDTVQMALKHLSESGIVKSNLGYSIHRMISELPEEVALDALDAFGSSDMGRVRNREGYLVGILKKHANRIGVTFSR